jgi:hypothetical protein
MPKMQVMADAQRQAKFNTIGPGNFIHVHTRRVRGTTFFTRDAEINKPNSLLIFRYQDIVRATVTMNPPTRMEDLQLIQDELRNSIE